MVFFNKLDYADYITLMVAAKARGGVEVWAYCLMPNHVYFVVTPSTEDGLRRLFGEAQHRAAVWSAAELGVVSPDQGRPPTL